MLVWLEDPVNIAVLGTMLVTISSLLSALLPDGNIVMRIINVIALNFGRARNDPGVQ